MLFSLQEYFEFHRAWGTACVVNMAILVASGNGFEFFLEHTVQLIMVDEFCDNLLTNKH